MLAPIEFYHAKQKARTFTLIAIGAWQLNNNELSERYLKEVNWLVSGTFGEQRDRLEEIVADAEEEAMAPFRVEKH